MKEVLFKYLITNQNDLNIFQVSEVMAIAIAVSFIIFATYKITYSGVMYNRKFNVSLVMITVVTTMVMIVIGSNIALSLGMVGALSIVRYRTAIKDPRDTTYIFWAIAVGLCVGTYNYVIGVVGSLILAVLLFVLSAGGFGMNDRYILIIRGDRNYQQEIMKAVFHNFKGSHLRSQNTNRDTLELVYQVVLKKGKNKSFVSDLYNIDGVTNVNLVAQNGETIG